MLNKDDDITIIWFDDKIDQEINDTLEQLHDHIIICFTISELINFIDNIQNEKIILIISGKYSRQTLTLVHNNDKIDSIYIFCLNDQFYKDLIDNKQYSKLIGIYTQYDQLFTILEKQIHLLLKHLSIFNLFDQIDKPIRDLEQESINYLWYQLLRDTLMTMETQTEQSKQEMIDYCRLYFHSNSTYLKQIDEFQQTYRSSDAIRWYTKDCFLFRFVNKALRTENIESLFQLRYFIKDLCKNLKLLFDENFQLYQESLDTITFYRGLTLSDKDINQLKQSIKKYISTNGFLSTSFYRNIAETFSKNVIFEIQIDTKLNNIIYADISKMSYNIDEEEVLFDIGAIFQIIDVKMNNDKCIVSMIGINNNIEYLKNDYFQLEQKYLQENMIDNILSNINANSFFGEFLLTMGYTNKAIDYFENLLKQLSNSIFNEYEIYIITGNLADAYISNKQYNLALKYALDSYNICKNFKFNYSVSISASLLRRFYLNIIIIAYSICIVNH
ncbi:unnamed protein product [Didymodactylos carnosus]|uniref:ADP ribosyltransferase domain-containing protein n=1 Tax=Didymodactylos carnosus TaxID=1234261 RepID=A0A814Q4T6_9BILA|nr:unnamed protein product [Didymodactylos carnosus]CAF1258864.1 unnamed protein product [Didymodactylos carnosus]CAF3878779.1 unnamed protein product [Didymodactylos carnosus]CAF4065705.1 unnamed protein product [Didymodactylos carnosus]